MPNENTPNESALYESVVPQRIQFHILTSYAGVLLNRDDSGMAKRLRFGDASRIRVSSQSLKRHLRMSDGPHALHSIDGAVHAVRSRRIIEQRVMRPLRDRAGLSEEWIAEVEKAFNLGLYGEKGEAMSGRQPLIQGLPEVEYLQQKAVEIADAHPGSVTDAVAAVQVLFSDKGEGPNFRTWRQQAALPGGLESALFGRMVTSDPAANIDAAIHVAHAFSVHAEESESDYYAVVDDLHEADEDAGAAHIGNTELTSVILYSYVNVDVPLLVSNLEGCREDEWLQADRSMAAAAVGNLTKLMAKQSPGAKLGSTAPYSRADLMMIECGIHQPRQLANAFRAPVAAQVAAAQSALGEYLTLLDDAYGQEEVRRFMSVLPCELPGATRVNLNALSEWVAGAVTAGEVK